MPSMTTIRPFDFSDADYHAVCAVYHANYPKMPINPEDFRVRDRRDPQKYVMRRWVAEIDGKVVGSGEFAHDHWVYHPKKFIITVRVMPNLLGQGIGKALYETVMKNIAEFEPVAVRTYVREDSLRGIEFFSQRGFVETFRDWFSTLDLDRFDFTKWEKVESAVASQGIVIRSLADLTKTDTTATRKFYDVDMEITKDVPAPDTRTLPDFATYSQQVLAHPTTNLESMFVALDGEKFVGISCLYRDPGNANNMNTGLTGVIRSHRRRKIATALKLRALRYARDHGCREVGTFNEINNQGMLTINDALGFQKLPVWILFEKTL